MLLDIYWNILTMHGLINVNSPNNISKWQMEFNSAFKGLSKADYERQQHHPKRLRSPSKLQDVT
jgi:hypothetical protein